MVDPKHKFKQHVFSDILPLAIVQSMRLEVVIMLVYDFTLRAIHISTLQKVLPLHDDGLVSFR